MSTAQRQKKRRRGRRGRAITFAKACFYAPPAFIDTLWAEAEEREMFLGQLVEEAFRLRTRTIFTSNKP